VQGLQDNIPSSSRDRTQIPTGAYMKILRHRIELPTTEAIQILDITGQVRDWVAASGVREGLLTLISPHTTARVNVNEREAQLQRDMITYLKRLVPRDGDWLHNLSTVDGRDNAH